MTTCAPNTWCVSPSQDWEGNDGPWSTFTIRVGTPPKPVRVLPATSQDTTWTVLPIGCSGYTDAPANCTEARGETFDPSQSTSFVYDNGTSATTSTFELPYTAESPLRTNVTAYAANATVGTDVMTLGAEGNDSPQLMHQTLACYASRSPWLGQLGLKAQNATISNSTDDHESVLGYLNSTGSVTSATFGYTAGSLNRSVFGSLTFGGYDADRGNVDNVITQQMSAPSYKDLQIGVSALSIGSTTVAGFDSTATYLIDSLVPEIYLPESACDQIQAAYGLNYSYDYELYYLSDTQHRNLTNLDQSTIALTFTLQTLGGSDKSTEITIPYADLDHQLSYPLGGLASGSSVRYFPIKRASSSDQYFLGRTFLQDAYLGVNYQNQVFNISPALFPTLNTQSNIIPIYQHAAGSTQKKSSGLSGGAIAGIVIGAVAAVALIAALIFFFLRKRRTERNRLSTAATMRPSMDGTTINNDRPDMAGYYDPQAEDVKTPGQDTYEHYNKGPIEMNGEEQDQFKPELAGSGAHREMSSSRHELYGSSVRRRSDQSRASISPLPREESQRGRFRHLRQESDSSFGQPSPASLTSSPPLGPEQMSGHPSPPMEMAGTFAGPFELYGGSMARREVTSAPTDTPTLPRAEITQPEEGSAEAHAQAADTPAITTQSPSTDGSGEEDTGPRNEHT